MRLQPTVLVLAVKVLFYLLTKQNAGLRTPRLVGLRARSLKSSPKPRLRYPKQRYIQLLNMPPPRQSARYWKVGEPVSRSGRVLNGKHLPGLRGSGY